jgi:wyosine [tRNA(Phe)-imidazoG37] synthetase (radical SAM superfamily)
MPFITFFKKGLSTLKAFQIPLKKNVFTHEELKSIADFVVRLNPDKSYLSIPTRLPAEKWVKPVTEHVINRAYQIFSEKAIDVEYLIGLELFLKRLS